MESHEPTIRVHGNTDRFRAAVRFTAAQTGFSPRLIEKDYFCTLLLAHLSAVERIVFKGGTCLAKVHGGFYRLSEDLDFAISMPPTAARSARSQQAQRLKQAIDAPPPEFSVIAPLRGANNSTQYNGTVRYTSLLGDQEETLSVELSLREALIRPPEMGQARTILLNPITHRPLVASRQVASIDRLQAYAEKFRAALSRREVAIRDFFDLDYAVQRLGLRSQDPTLIDLVRTKLALPGNDPLNVGAERLSSLRQQLDGRLKPVLRAHDFEAFDLERAVTLVVEMAAVVRG